MPDAADPLHAADEESVRALSQPGTLRVFLALIDAPATEEALALALRIPRPELAMRLAMLEDAGLVGVEPAEDDPAAPRRLRARYAHLQHALDGAGALVSMRRGMLRVAHMLVEDGERALAARGDAARAGIGVVTLADDPRVLLEAARIMAEAENRIRELARAQPPRPGGPEARVALLILPAP